ncbi:MAG: hypothetical protein V1821_04185 [bacterium]
MNYLDRISSWDFWMSVRQPAITVNTAFIGIVFFLVILIVGLSFRSYARKLKKQDRLISKLWRQAGTAAIIAAVCGWFLIFFSYEGVPLFGMRVWYIIWLLAVIAEAAWLIYYRNKRLPEILAAHHEAAIKRN